MIEDFIEFNKLKTTIITFPTSTSTQMLIASNVVPATATVKIQVFNSPKNEPILTVIPFQSELNFKLLKLIVNEGDLMELNLRETLLVTGYAKDFVPPISIYGVRILIDSSLEKKSFIFARISDKSFVKIPMNEILDTNDDVSFENLID